MRRDKVKNSILSGMKDVSVLFLGEIICPSIQGGSLRSSAAVRTGPEEKLEELQRAKV